MYSYVIVKKIVAAVVPPLKRPPDPRVGSDWLRCKPTVSRRPLASFERFFDLPVIMFYCACHNSAIVFQSSIIITLLLSSSLFGIEFHRTQKKDK